MLKKILKFLFIDDVLKSDIDFLKNIILFQNLSERSLAKIALIIFKKTYFAGEKVYGADQEANVFYIVKNGQISLSNNKSASIIKTGEFFGEIALIEYCKHNNSAVALKDSELYLIYRAKFNDISESNNKLGLIIMKNLASLFAKSEKYQNYD
jgi:CRP-like cAMP-binding protein